MMAAVIWCCVFNLSWALGCHAYAFNDILITFFIKRLLTVLRRHFCPSVCLCVRLSNVCNCALWQSERKLCPHSCPWMTYNGVIALILRYFTEFDSFANRLRHSDWSYTYNVRKISCSSYSWPKLTDAAVAQSLCDSWASCYYCFQSATFFRFFLTFLRFFVFLNFYIYALKRPSETHESPVTRVKWRRILFVKSGDFRRSSKNTMIEDSFAKKWAKLILILITFFIKRLLTVLRRHFCPSVCLCVRLSNVCNVCPCAMCAQRSASERHFSGQESRVKPVNPESGRM